jgi:hypothetical protein
MVPKNAQTIAALLSVCLLFTGAVYAQSTEVVGLVEAVQTDDFDGNRSEISYWIVDDVSGKAYKARFTGDPDKFPDSGALIRARGKFVNGEFMVDVGSGTSAPTYQVIEAAPAPSVADSVAVIIVDFQDAAVACSPDDIATRMFPRTGNTNVSEYYIEASNGEFGFLRDADTDGYLDVFGPYRINALSTEACDYYSWAYKAEDMALAAGVDLSVFKHLLFVIPSTNTCTWAGVANVGCGVQCRSWVARCSMSDLYAHELGHNLSMRHASTDTNNDGVTDSEYGDYSDVMGYSNVGWRDPNAPHKEQMGWFNDFPGQIQTINTSGTYTLAPLDRYPWEVDQPQILKIYKADTGEYYYLSYRLKIGYSSTLRTAYAEHVNIHRYKGSGSIATKFIKALSDGGQFQDAALGVTVTQLSHNADPATGFATLTVSFGSVPVAPSLTILPTSQTATSLVTLSYAISVRNNDAASASASTFTLSAGVPSGWTGQWSANSITLAPGQSGTLTLGVTPAAAAVDSTYAINVVVTATDGQHPTATGTLNYVLDAYAPQPVIDLAGVQSPSGAVQLAWSASPDGTGFAAKYRVYRDTGSGFAVIGESTSTSFSDGATVVATDSVFRYEAVAIDSGGHVSSDGNVASVPVKAKTKKKGGPR